MSPTPKFYTLAAEDLPTQRYSLKFQKPYYEDYRLSRRRYPSDRFPGDNTPRPGYSVDELLLAMMLKEVNDAPFDPYPKDMAERLYPFPIQDRQYLMMVFSELFFISRDQVQAVRDYADKQTYQPNYIYEVPAKLLPSGKKSFSFYSPNTGVQMEVDRRYQSGSSGATLEETLLAHCLAAVDGKQIEEGIKDPITLLDDWEIADVQWAALLFVNMFTIDDSQAQAAKKRAKLLKEQDDGDLPVVVKPSRRTSHAMPTNPEPSPAMSST